MNRTRKRRHEAPPPKHSREILTDAPPKAKEQLVVDAAKVIQALKKLPAQETPACIKIPVSDSEAQHFEALQDSLTETFSVNITFLAASVSLDRIITVYGDLALCLRCSLYIGFILNSSINNFGKSETYTLKSANYKLLVLVEATDLQIASLEKKFPANTIDVGPYERNANLHAANLTGDFNSLFNSLKFIFSLHPYTKYATDESIKGLPVVGVYERLIKPFDAPKNNQTILNFLYDKHFLSEEEANEKN